MKISVESEQFGCYLISNDEDDRTILIQVDYDYCGVASSFGWVACECGFTDGTVDCGHRTASEMISEASEYLDECDHEVGDPGYFDFDD